MKRHFWILAALPLLTASCLKDNDDTDDTELWKSRNEQFITETAKDTQYEKITPAWAPNAYVLVKWHNDRSLTQKNLVPMDNSTVDVKYELRDIDDNLLDSSYASTAFGDSIYRTQPEGTVIGFHTALTHMHVGDSVTMVMPYQAGYGTQSVGKIKPFSTLIFHLKLKSVYRYEIPN